MQSTEQRCSAIESLLPLLEAEIDLAPGRLKVQSYGEGEAWVPPPGWTPPPDLSHCTGRCPECKVRQAAMSKHLPCPAEELWAREWRRLRQAYPVLLELEELVRGLSYDHPHWASALYWHYVQPWDDFQRDKREEWAAEAVAWLAEEINGEVPFYQPEYPTRTYSTRDRKIIRLRIQGRSYAFIAAEVRCSKSTIKAVLHGLEVRRGRAESAKG